MVILSMDKWLDSHLYLKKKKEEKYGEIKGKLVSFN